MIIMLGSGLMASAQEEVPREILLTTLNSVAHLKFENEQVNQLMEYNEAGIWDDGFDPKKNR